MYLLKYSGLPTCFYIVVLICLRCLFGQCEFEPNLNIFSLLSNRFLDQEEKYHSQHYPRFFWMSCNKYECLMFHLEISGWICHALACWQCWLCGDLASLRNLLRRLDPAASGGRWMSLRCRALGNLSERAAGEVWFFLELFFETCGFDMSSYFSKLYCS